MADSSREDFGRVLQRGFLGGVDTRRQADLLAETQVVEARNADLSRSTLRRRPGLSSVLTVTGSLAAEYQPVLMQTVLLPGKGERLFGLVNVGNSSSKFFIYDGSDSGALTYAGPGMFSEEGDLVLFGDRVYALDPNSPARYWKSGDVSMREDEAGIRGTPHGTSGLFFQFRGYVVGDPGRPDLIYFSKLLGNAAVNADEEQTGQRGDQTLVWHPEQSFRLSTGNGVKLLPFRNSAIIILTDRGIESFEPNNCNPLDPTMLVLSRHFGCSSKHGARVVGEDIFFPDQVGHIRSLKQSLTDESQGVLDRPLTEPISDVISRVNPQRLKAIRAFTFANHYIVGFPTDYSEQAAEFWAYKLDDHSWIGPWTFKDDLAGTRLTFPCIATARLAREDRERAFGVAKSSTDAKLFRMFQSRTDDSSTITWRLVTRAFDGGAPDIDKQWQHFDVRFRFLDQATGDANVSLLWRARLDEGPWTTSATATITPDGTPELDDSGTPPVVGTAVIADYKDQIVKVQLTGMGTGRTLQLELTVTDATAAFEILGVHATALQNNVRFT